MGLNLDCTNHFNQWKSYEILFAGNLAAVALRLPFKNRVGLFTGDMKFVRLCSDRANASVEGITTAKDTIKKTASVSWGDITSNVYSYAVDQGNVGLQNYMLKSTANYILKIKDENFVSTCNDLNITIAALILADPAGTADYFTASEATLAMDDVAKFVSTLGVYKNAIEDVNKAKQEFEISWIPKIKVHLKALKGLLPGIITTTYLAFAQKYDGLYKLINAGRRKQGVDAVMEDADGNVIVLIGTMDVINYPVVQKPKVTKNDSNGFFKLMSLKIGTWTVKFSAPGFKDQTIIVKTTLREIAHLTVTMVAV